MPLFVYYVVMEVDWLLLTEGQTSLTLLLQNFTVKPRPTLVTIATSVTLPVLLWDICTYDDY